MSSFVQNPWRSACLAPDGVIIWVHKIALTAAVHDAFTRETEGGFVIQREFVIRAVAGDYRHIQIALVCQSLFKAFEASVAFLAGGVANTTLHIAALHTHTSFVDVEVIRVAGSTLS